MTRLHYFRTKVFNCAPCSELELEKSSGGLVLEEAKECEVSGHPEFEKQGFPMFSILKFSCNFKEFQLKKKEV